MLSVTPSKKYKASFRTLTALQQSGNSCVFPDGKNSALILVHFFLCISLAVLSRNKGSETSWVKSGPLLVLASELQESFDNCDFTLSSYLSVKGKLHSFDGKAFYLCDIGAWPCVE